MTVRIQLNIAGIHEVANLDKGPSLSEHLYAFYHYLRNPGAFHDNIGPPPVSQVFDELMTVFLRCCCGVERMGCAKVS